MQFLTESADVRVVEGPAAAGTTDLTSDSVDMAGYDGVLFIAHMGAITSSAVTSLKAQQSSDDGDADSFADLAGASVTIPDDGDDSCFVLDVYQPRERYVLCVLDRGTQNAVLNGIIAIPYRANSRPITPTSTTTQVRDVAEA